MSTDAKPAKKQKPKKPIQILKERRPPTPQWLKDKVKEARAVKADILKALEEGPLTIPEIAEKTGHPADVVLFYFTSLRRYRQVELAEKDYEYHKYKLVEV